MAKIIDGRVMAQKIKEEVTRKVAIFRDITDGIQPSLTAILVGKNLASVIYIKNKEKACKMCGIKFEKLELRQETSEAELLDIIEKRNKDKDVHGILVQLPLPKHIYIKKLIKSIDYRKDIDGFNPVNVGKLALEELEGAEGGITPCTAKGIIKMIKSAIGEDLSGKRAIMIGRSNLVGKPTSCLLLKENCTVKIAHSKTRNLKEECLWADIVIVAVGKPNLITADMIKPGATVIDVGMNRTEKGLCGDVDFESVKKVAGYITPVPGGVGQMTVACLMENIYEACERLTQQKDL
jgi:methylenetetrahydrofolate dehydrogenase (NADP+) / methenyltetrahydrofolate cyclohydrolase